MEYAIVEDSRLARKELLRMLQNFPDLQCIVEAENASDAVKMLVEKKPLLVFMDINLNDKTGFEVLTDLDYQPFVIFTTAFDQFALRSFEFNTVDYLVKPIEETALKRSIDKAKKVIKETDVEHREVAEIGDEKIFETGEKIFIKDGDKCYFVKVEEVFLFEVSGPYTKVYFEGASPSVPRALNLIERRMDPKIFFRANRNQIINLQHVQKVTAWFNHTLKVTMKNGVEVELSRRKSFEFKEMSSL